jgi:hypothetical protein
LEELAVLMTRSAQPVCVQLVFFKPAPWADDWAHTDLWRKSGQLPEADRLIDRDGYEQNRFGASVSGELFVFHPSGRLMFHGGITGGRGHVGDNPSRLKLESLLTGQAIATHEAAPVFGCSLVRPTQSSARCSAEFHCDETN